MIFGWNVTGKSFLGSEWQHVNAEVNFLLPANLRTHCFFYLCFCLSDFISQSFLMCGGGTEVWGYLSCLKTIFFIITAVCMHLLPYLHFPCHTDDSVSAVCFGEWCQVTKNLSTLWRVILFPVRDNLDRIPSRFHHRVRLSTESKM